MPKKTKKSKKSKKELEAQAKKLEKKRMIQDYLSHQRTEAHAKRRRNKELGRQLKFGGSDGQS